MVWCTLYWWWYSPGRLFVAVGALLCSPVEASHFFRGSQSLRSPQLPPPGGVWCTSHVVRSCCRGLLVGECLCDSFHLVPEHDTPTEPTYLHAVQWQQHAVRPGQGMSNFSTFAHEQIRPSTPGPCPTWQHSGSAQHGPGGQTANLAHAGSAGSTSGDVRAWGAATTLRLYLLHSSRFKAPARIVGLCIATWAGFRGPRAAPTQGAAPVPAEAFRGVP